MPDTSSSIAERFVRARHAAEALPEYPGLIPTTLDAAYVIQDHAISSWHDPIAGWKVGRVAPSWSERFDEDRVLGPIFHRAVQAVRSGDAVEFPVFVGGFAAVEAEFIFRLAADAPADKLSWTAEEAANLVGQMHIGIEPAGSPLATINDLGPAVIASDFGNNAGLILGPVVPNWRERPLETLTTETFIDERSVGKGSAASIPGGPLSALAFALSRNARRGRPLKARDLISTGATTGVHSIFAGQSARVDFGACGQIRCRAVPAKKS
jgi:2-keto-4-pentenoate hydratase